MPKYSPKLPKPLRPIDPDNAKRSVFALAQHYEAYDGEWHAHARAQLIHASEGVLSVHTPEGRWVIPPQRAVWVAPGVAHKVSSKRSFLLTTLYAAPDFALVSGRSCVVAVDPLVYELLIAAAEFGPDYALGGAEERLIAVILDRLPPLPLAPFHLPQPRDARLRRMTAALATQPARNETLGELAASANLPPRTAARLFVKETGLTFGQWRQQLRLLAALEKLGAGESVTAVALDVGYADISSFISIFKAAFGQTPARYFRRASS